MIPLNLPRRSNIQGLWHLDEESGIRYDKSPNGNNLTDIATVLYGAGKIGNAADFELDNVEYLRILDADQTGLDITGEITICAWIKLETIATSMGTISKYSSTDNKRAYMLQFLNDQKIYFRLSANGTAVTSAVSSSTLNAATLYHIAATLNQTTDLMQIYIAGLADGDAVSYTTDIYDNAKKFMISGYNDSAGDTQIFDGLIDEVIIWNKCLTAAEVLVVKNITAYNYCAGIGIGNPYIF